MQWLAEQKPIEGKRAGGPTVGTFARDDVVTCVLADTIGEVRRRVDESPYPLALVLSGGGVVLGRLADLDGDPERRAEDVMESGPSTKRPHRTPATVAAQLAEQGLEWAIVTTPEGVLIGVVPVAELEAAAGA